MRFMPHRTSAIVAAMLTRFALLLLVLPTAARADDKLEPVDADPPRPRAQLQIDGGLSVIGPGYEHPITQHISVQVEAFVFGTYFLPWFDAGEDMKGFGAGVRPTWFARPSRRGLYVAPYFRFVAVDDEAIANPSGVGFTAGAFVGWAFRPGKRIDVRIGGGAQYIYAKADGAMDEELTSSTPFLAIDAVLGYRL
jgi:hypothetical protein